jgi:hypothetical protein
VEGLRCKSLSGGVVTQLPPGEIRDIFDHLGESSNELKSEQSKSSIAACPVGIRHQQLLTNQPPCRPTSENLPVPDGPLHQGKAGLKHPKPNPPKLSNKEGQHPLSQSPAYQSQEETETLTKLLSKVPASGFEARGKSPELSVN